MGVHVQLLNNRRILRLANNEYHNSGRGKLVNNFTGHCTMVITGQCHDIFQPFWSQNFTFASSKRNKPTASFFTRTVTVHFYFFFGDTVSYSNYCMQSNIYVRTPKYLRSRSSMFKMGPHGTYVFSELTRVDYIVTMSLDVI